MWQSVLEGSSKSKSVFFILRNWRVFSTYGLNFYSMTISRTFKSATNSGTFESATIFFFAFLDDLGDFKQNKVSVTFKSTTTISCTFECTTNSCTVEVQSLSNIM